MFFPQGVLMKSKLPASELFPKRAETRQEQELLVSHAPDTLATGGSMCDKIIWQNLPFPSAPISMCPVVISHSFPLSTELHFGPSVPFQ